MDGRWWRGGGSVAWLSEKKKIYRYRYINIYIYRYTPILASALTPFLTLPLICTASSWQKTLHVFSCRRNHAEDRPDCHGDPIQQSSPPDCKSALLQTSKSICSWNIYLFLPWSSHWRQHNFRRSNKCLIEEKMTPMISIWIRSLTIFSLCKEPSLSQAVRCPLLASLFFSLFCVTQTPAFATAHPLHSDPTPVIHHLCDFRQFASNPLHSICNTLRRSMEIHSTSGSCYEDSLW